MQIGVEEAKLKFSELLRRVEKGERVVIVKHGTPVAVLEPVNRQKRDVVKVIEAVKELRKGHGLGELKIKDMIEEGRM